jgi:uncharacterized integral membrane protein
MGEQTLYQQLTREDKITVAIYRTGIVVSTMVICLFAYILYDPSQFAENPSKDLMLNALLLMLYISIGLSVFFIHLYISKFKRTLKRLYYLAIFSLAFLYYLGGGDAVSVVVSKPYGSLFFIPLSLCLGFVTAKEAFCFRLTEGYIIAMLMPIMLVLYSIGGMSGNRATYGLILVAVLLVLFNIRKVFQPIHYDIGDKSAYQ